MALARRMFEKSLYDDKRRAEYAMTEIQKLYQIERQARQLGLSPEQRHELRLDESLPAMNELGKWMAAQVRTSLPKIPCGKALIYSISRWDNLMNYLKDGYLEIDNNLVYTNIWITWWKMLSGPWLEKRTIYLPAPMQEHKVLRCSIHSLLLVNTIM